MSKTAIIYWSGTGNTETMAMAVADGAKQVNPDAALFSGIGYNGGRGGGI